jgi:hypothetical protein
VSNGPPVDHEAAKIISRVEHRERRGCIAVRGAISGAHRFMLDTFAVYRADRRDYLIIDLP